MHRNAMVTPQFAHLFALVAGAGGIELVEIFEPRVRPRRPPLSASLAAVGEVVSAHGPHPGADLADHRLQGRFEIAPRLGLGGFFVAGNVVIESVVAPTRTDVAVFEGHGVYLEEAVIG